MMATPQIDVELLRYTAPIVREILTGYRLPVDGIHGVGHWGRVLENGYQLAAETGANLDVVVLFALFHDSRRVNEDYDEGHGQRGAELARKMRASLPWLPEADFDLLTEACRLHTDGLLDGDVTLQTCWDADRLDLGRVGITPSVDRLCSDAARALCDWRISGQWHMPYQSSWPRSGRATRTAIRTVPGTDSKERQLLLNWRLNRFLAPFGLAAAATEPADPGQAGGLIRRWAIDRGRALGLGMFQRSAKGASENHFARASSSTNRSINGCVHSAHSL